MFADNQESRYSWEQKVRIGERQVIHSAHQYGRSSYLVHRALKSGIFRVIPTLFDWEDDSPSWMHQFKDGYDEQCLILDNYPEIWNAIKQKEDKAILDAMAWP